MNSRLIRFVAVLHFSFCLKAVYLERTKRMHFSLLPRINLILGPARSSRTCSDLEPMGSGRLDSFQGQGHKSSFVYYTMMEAV